MRGSRERDALLFTYLVYCLSELFFQVIVILYFLFSSNIDLDLSEIDSLKQKEGYTTTYDDNKKSVDALMKDYERFQGNLKKVTSIQFFRLQKLIYSLPCSYTKR